MLHPTERSLPYPRLCAHRGYNYAAPENTLPAFAMAVAMGADEIELDLWPSKDGDLIVCHDASVDRTTDGTGLIADLTTAEIRALDAGGWFSPAFRGVRLPLFEEVLDLLGGKCIINIHIKSPAAAEVPHPVMTQRDLEWEHYYNGKILLPPPLPTGIEDVLPEIENRPLIPYDAQVFQRILDALDKYGCREYAYIAGAKDVLHTARTMAPDIPRTSLEGDMNYALVEHAVEYGCAKVQFCKGFTTQAMLDRAKAHGLICNLFWADDPQEARQFFDLGIDCILTNNFLPVKAVLDK